MDKWNSMPAWARWILYIPAVFVLPLLAAGLFTLLNDQFFAPGTTRFILLIMLAAAINALCFTWLAVNLAPKFNKSLAWTLYSAAGLICLLAMVHAVHTWFWTPEGFTYDTITEFLQSGVWVGTGLCTLLAITRQSTPDPN